MTDFYVGRDDTWLYILAYVMIVFTIFSISSFFFWDGIAENYKTEIKTTCEDKDGDVIEGQVCYKTVRCANKLKLFNEEGCEDFVLSMVGEEK